MKKKTNTNKKTQKKKIRQILKRDTNYVDLQKKIIGKKIIYISDYKKTKISLKL